MATVNILYLTEAHPLWNSELRWQVTNINDAKLAEYDKKGNELETFGAAELDESLGWNVIAVETDLKPKDIIDGYWLDIIDGEDEGQLLELETQDRNSAILEQERLFAENATAVRGSPTMEDVIKAALEGKVITVDGKPIDFEGLA